MPNPKLPKVAKNHLAFSSPNHGITQTQNVLEQLLLIVEFFIYFVLILGCDSYC
ncbi:hypothetical protein SLEP1_g51297 [Rubroshorea leprosula]|uniref:Uncharacterized protein n=1 Tax=Rubroshorea leprosula TaxID=152421 RepID=A0AAV5M2Y1_9ROSI|nr:hypothetical protein SLEP1_g51297 [Rubroshorea leprosula]